MTEMNSKQIFWASFIFIFLLAFSLRYYPSTFGQLNDPDAFFHVRNINTILETGEIPLYDELSMQGRYYSYPILFHPLFAGLIELSGLPTETVFQFIPAFIGAMSCAALFLIGRKLFNEKIGLIAMLFLTVTSIHVLRTFAFSRPDGISLFLIPIIIYVILEEQYPLAALLSIGMALLHPLSTTFLILLLIAWMVLAILKKVEINHSKKFFIWISITILTSIGSIGLWLGTIPLPLSNYVSKMAFNSAELIQFSFLNFLMFFSLIWFFGVLALIKLKENYFLKMWTVLGLLFATVGARMAIHLSIPLSLLGATQFEFLYEKIQPYQKALFLILFFWIVLVVYSTLNVAGPYLTLADQEGMKFLQNIPESDSVFSKWDRGHALAYFSERKVVLDGYFEYAPQLLERSESMNEVFASSNCEKIASNLKKWNSNYVYLSKRELNGISEKNGILEAKNCEQLNSIYQSNSGKILKFNPSLDSFSK